MSTGSDYVLRERCRLWSGGILPLYQDLREDWEYWSFEQV